MGRRANSGKRGHSLNYLLRVREVNELYMQFKQRGYTNRWIYKNCIFPRFYISECTMYNYLQVPYKRLLRDLAWPHDASLFAEVSNDNE